MTINVAQFRADFPEFADSGKFTSPVIDFWIGMAAQMINQDTWGASAIDEWPTNITSAPTRTPFDLGTELFVAHNIVLESIAARSAANGKTPGGATGAIQSKSVDKVSLSYDTSGSMMADAGHWNLTVYGLRFRMMQRMAGAAPLQSGAGISNFVSVTGSGFGWN